MTLQRPTKQTLVEQIAAQLEQLIEDGTWPVGERIPAEPELVKELGVSRNTIREAIHALIHAGMLRTRQGMEPMCALPAAWRRH
ncbi:GntR family transcriptional regulator [Paenibacillus sp. JTLBN-2024]